MTPKTPLTTRLRAAWSTLVRGSIAPFDRLFTAGSGQAPKLNQPYAQSVWVSSAVRHITRPITDVSLKFSADSRKGEIEITDHMVLDYWSAPAIGPGGQPLSCEDVTEQSLTWLMLSGEFFWVFDDSWLVGTRAKSPFIIARPDRIRPIVKGGELIGWQYKDADKQQHTLLPQQVLHCKNFNPYDDWRGLGQLAVAQIAAETDYQAGIFARNIMSSNGDQGVYVISDQQLQDDQQEQILAQLRAKKAAAARGDYKAAFLTGGVRVEDAKIKAPDANFASVRQSTRHEIYAAFGIPMSMAEVMQSYSIGSASAWYQLIIDTCRPIGKKLSEAIEAVERRRGRNLYAWHDWDEHPVMQQVRSERIDAATKMWDRGMPWSEINNYLDLALPEFPGWDTGYVSFGLAPVSEMTTGQNLPEAAPDFQEAEGPLPNEEDTQEEESPEAAVQAAFREAKRSVGSVGSVQSDRSPESCTCGEGLSLDLDNLPVDTTRAPGDLARWRTLMAQRRETIKTFETRYTKWMRETRAAVLAKLAIVGGEQRTPSARAAQVDITVEQQQSATLLVSTIQEAQTFALGVAGQQLFAELRKDSVWTTPPAEVMQYHAARQNLIRKASDDVFQAINSTLAEGYQAGETTAELTARVKAAFKDITPGRARRIAMTETSAAYGQGRHLAMTTAGVQRKRWLTSGNPNVRAAHRDADGQTVNIDAPFRVGGEALMHPGDPNGSAGNVINCHCVSIAVAE